ncbi:hypothetical protein BABINDRAFT_163942 [Babjeviella inositovora NRRL Y-12698]|uniref:Protein SIP5 n=1 Tax=Babjeviella inositovora NRRL Y-12698 TaxID=984486 RepID=A0A1E3QGW5_9ASCO|nr:uncharacterized protein BABINDRAFT_163942 [Babjeviella inositovora NRRL Y-12698]ODQ76939.1 hypothetical protein BABINDRAFT_163942 [Babjeviella inositovora NRRL Y-12698]
MGNAPGREERGPQTLPRERSQFGDKLTAHLKRKKKEEEREKLLETRYTNLVVRYQETVDGGYLAPYGTYKAFPDYDTLVVKLLITERKLAPFYSPLDDFDETWTQEELLVVLMNNLRLFLPNRTAEDEEIDDADDHKLHKSQTLMKRLEQKQKLKALIERTIKQQKKEQLRYNHDRQQAFVSENGSTRYPSIPSNDLLLALYGNAIECPICFVYYPPHMNYSRCCEQPICTECFVHIRRNEPHPPHDVPEEEATDPESLISLPANCPFCAMPDFGVTYTPPLLICTGIQGSCAPAEFSIYTRNDLVIEEEEGSSKPKTRARAISAAISLSHSGMGSPRNSVEAGLARSSVDAGLVRRLNDGSAASSNTNLEAPKRRGSLAASAPGVITTDAIQPDWETKLMSARARIARRSAAATAIHASSLIIQGDETSDIDRRRLFRRTGSAQEQLAIEERMIQQAMKLSLLEEEQRQHTERARRGE